MKQLSIRFAVVVVALATQIEAHAQPPARVASTRPLYNVQSDYGVAARHVPRPIVFWSHASTAAEGYARGIAATIYAQGVYNRLTAEARAIHAEAVRREIENRQQRVNAYFAIRERNRQARAAERRPHPAAADLVRYASAAKPDRLSPSELSPVTGKVSWPTLLQAEQFTGPRAELEQLLVLRTVQGDLGTVQREQARRAANAMLAELRKHVREVHGTDYTTALRFIKSLTYEARLPMS